MTSAAVYINCSRFPFVDQIMHFQKLVETRSRDTLRAVVGRRVYLAESGRGRSVIRCSAIIGHPIAVRSREEWDAFRDLHLVPAGSQYDWKPETRVKYLYPIYGIEACDPFPVPAGVRHGRVWMEFTEQ